jgi:uncharacterized protein (TIGR02246 family)
LKATWDFDIITDAPRGTHMKKSLIPIAALVLLTSCTQAPPPTPPDTRADDEKAIRDQEAAALLAWNSKNVDQIVALYAEDATLMLPNAPLLKGKQAMTPVLKEALADPNFSLEIKNTSAEASKGGDLGFVRGSYVVHQSDPKTKKAMMEKGNYVIVYKKQGDGSWKIVADTAIPEAPATPAAK